MKYLDVRVEGSEPRDVLQMVEASDHADEGMRPLRREDGVGEAFLDAEKKAGAFLDGRKIDAEEQRDALGGGFSESVSWNAASELQFEHLFQLKGLAETEGRSCLFSGRNISDEILSVSREIIGDDGFRECCDGVVFLCRRPVRRVRERDKTLLFDGAQEMVNDFIVNHAREIKVFELVRGGSDGRETVHLPQCRLQMVARNTEQAVVLMEGYSKEQFLAFSWRQGFQWIRRKTVGDALSVRLGDDETDFCKIVQVTAHGIEIQDNRRFCACLWRTGENGVGGFQLFQEFCGGQGSVRGV